MEYLLNIGFNGINGSIQVEKMTKLKQLCLKVCAFKIKKHTDFDFKRVYLDEQHDQRIDCYQEETVNRIDKKNKIDNKTLRLCLKYWRHIQLFLVTCDIPNFWILLQQVVLIYL